MNDKIQGIPEQSATNLFGDELNIDFQHYLRILRKHKWSIVLLTLLITVIAAFYAHTATSIYKSKATLLIESQKANVVSIEEIYGFDGAGAEYYQTQFELLKSRALAEKVVDKLNLSEHPLYSGAARPSSPLSMRTFKQITGIFSQQDEAVESTANDLALTGEATNDPDTAFDAGDAKKQALISRFMGGLSIDPVRRTQLVKITYQSPDPQLAALAANTFADTYIESYLDAKMEMTEKAADWLSNRLGGLEIKLSEAETRLIEFREQHQLIDMEGAVGTLSQQQVSIVTKDLAVARRELAEVEGLYTEIKRLQTSSPELLLSFPAVHNDQLVRTYKIELDQQQRQLDELSNRYGVKHPKVVDVQSRMDVIGSSLNRQVDQVVLSLKSDYDIAREKVNTLSRALSSGKREIQDISKKKFELSALERDVEANRKLYNTFFNRIRETDETGGLETANARISDLAIPAGGPFKPKKAMIVALAFLGGLIGSVLLAFLREQMDDSIKGTEEIEATVGVPLLGIIPLVKSGILGRKKQIPLSPFEIKDKRGTFVESIRTIRTSLCLDSLEKPHRKVVITSSIPGEGKSTMAINLAHSLSQIEKVILIDSDMRRPTVAKAFGIASDHPGLANYLKAQTRSEAVHISECVVRNLNDTNLDVLPCGTLPENPLELLASSRFSRLLEKLGEHYDRVIIDCAPTQAVSDALIVGKQADTVIYAIKSHATSMSLVRRGVKRLNQVGAHILGTVVTQVDVDKISSYGGDYYYQGYYDYYGYSNDGKKKKKSKSKSTDSTSKTTKKEQAVAEIA